MDAFSSIKAKRPTFGIVGRSRYVYSIHGVSGYCLHGYTFRLVNLDQPGQAGEKANSIESWVMLGGKKPLPGAIGCYERGFSWRVRLERERSDADLPPPLFAACSAFPPSLDPHAIRAIHAQCSPEPWPVAAVLGGPWPGTNHKGRAADDASTEDHKQLAPKVG